MTRSIFDRIVVSVRWMRLLKKTQQFSLFVGVIVTDAILKSFTEAIGEIRAIKQMLSTTPIYTCI